MKVYLTPSFVSLSALSGLVHACILTHIMLHEWSESDECVCVTGKKTFGLFTDQIHDVIRLPIVGIVTN